MSGEKGLPHSGKANAIICVAFALVGFILLWLYAAGTTSLDSILTTLGTTLLTIGIVSFASEHLLRRALTRDLLTKVNLSNTLHDTGLDSITPWAGSDSGAVVPGSKRVTIATHRPEILDGQLWRGLKACMASEAVTINIFLPDPASVDAARLAERLGMGYDLYRGNLEQAVSEIKRRWEDALRSGVHPKATLNVTYSTLDGGRSIIASDNGFLVILESVTTPASADELTVFKFRTRDELGRRADWIHEQVNSLVDQSGVPEWSVRGDRKVSR